MYRSAVDTRFKSLTTDMIKVLEVLFKKMSIKVLEIEQLFFLHCNGMTNLFSGLLLGGEMEYSKSGTITMDIA